MSEDAQPSTRRTSPPDTIDRERYPALEDLRRHCSRGGLMLIDRVYAEAQALHKRAKDAEAELALFVDVGEPVATFSRKPVAAPGEDLL